MNYLSVTFVESSLRIAGRARPSSRRERTLGWRTWLCATGRQQL